MEARIRRAVRAGASASPAGGLPPGPGGPALALTAAFHRHPLGLLRDRGGVPVLAG